MAQTDGKLENIMPLAPGYRQHTGMKRYQWEKQSRGLRFWEYVEQSGKLANEVCQLFKQNDALQTCTDARSEEAPIFSWGGKCPQSSTLPSVGIRCPHDMHRIKYLSLRLILLQNDLRFDLYVFCSFVFQCNNLTILYQNTQFSVKEIRKKGKKAVNTEMWLCRVSSLTLIHLSITSIQNKKKGQIS